MSARDELATVIHRRICEDSLSSCLEDDGYCAKAADEILTAGYTKPRTVTTLEELDALADGTLLMSGNRIPRYAWAVWRVKGGMVELVGHELRGVTPFRYFVDPLPATVLYDPTTPGLTAHQEGAR